MHKEQRNVMPGVGVGHYQCACVNVLDHRGHGLSEHRHSVRGSVAIAELTIEPPNIMVYK